MPDYRDNREPTNGMGIVGVIVGILIAFAFGYMLLGPNTTGPTNTARVDMPSSSAPTARPAPTTAPVTPAPATPSTPPAPKP